MGILRICQAIILDSKKKCGLIRETEFSWSSRGMQVIRIRADRFKTTEKCGQIQRKWDLINSSLLGSSNLIYLRRGYWDSNVYVVRRTLCT